MTADAAIRHWERIIAGGGLTNADLVYAARQLQKALRETERCDATGVTIHSISRDGRTVENTEVATTNREQERCSTPTHSHSVRSSQASAVSTSD